MAHEDGPSLERLYSIRTDGSRNTLHPADVRGRFIRARKILFRVLLAIYLAAPLVPIGGHPAVQLNIADRRFYLFGAVFNAQDLWFVLFLALVFCFGLLFVTAWLGRVWCGWACPQTVFLEGVYRKIERFIEGPREQRMRLQRAPLTVGKLARKIGKHAAFAAVSLFIAHATVSFFVSTKSLWVMVQHDPREHLEAFLWTMATASVLYFNFAWFREQFCIVMCPYGRMQSVLIDKDSLIVGYDTKRGEPRGKVGKAQGDCIDCNRCVVVCPTGIDIRDGLQMECIACTQCIDACDEMMDKVHRPRGLIRYDSLSGLEGEKRKLRGRTIVYGAITALALVGFVVSQLARTPFEANLLRVRGAPYVLDDGGVRNSFELHLVNKNPTPATFTVAVEAPASARVVMPERSVTLAPLESARLPIFVTLPRADYRGGFELPVDVADGHSGKRKQPTARFLGPPVGMMPRS